MRRINGAKHKGTDMRRLETEEQIADAIRQSKDILVGVFKNEEPAVYCVVRDPSGLSTISWKYKGKPGPHDIVVVNPIQFFIGLQLPLWIAD